MKILLQQLQSGEWLVWIDGTVKRGKGDSAGAAVLALIEAHPKDFGGVTFRRVFGEPVTGAPLSQLYPRLVKIRAEREREAV